VLVRRRTATGWRCLHSSAKRIVCSFTCDENFDWLAEDIEDRIVVHRYSFENVEKLWTGMLMGRDTHLGKRVISIDRKLILNNVFRVKLTIPIRALMKI
jgi:hypothetical protein